MGKEVRDKVFGTAEDTPLAKLSEKALRQTIAKARKVAEAMPDQPPHQQIPRLLEVAARDRTSASRELARREALVRMVRNEKLGRSSAQTGALQAVARFGHRELADERLSASQLTKDDGEELLSLVRKRRDEQLTEKEQARYETLVGKAAGDTELFPRKRAEQLEKSKIEALRVAERRHPEASSIIAAVLADPFLFDGLRDKYRPDTVEVDEYGHEHVGSTGRIFELESVAALHVLLSLLVANGGHPVEVREHGVLGDGLPRLPQGALGPLRLNAYLVVEKVAAGFRVGAGPRVRQIAARWDIDLPEPTARGNEG
jgi:hypothetical protein